MKLKDIANYIRRPFIVIIPGEKIDHDQVQMLVKIDNKYHVGHTIHGIEEDIENTRPEIMDYEIDELLSVRDYKDKSRIVVKFLK